MDKYKIIDLKNNMNKFCIQAKEYIGKLKQQAELLALPTDVELTPDNSKDWIDKFRNIDADMGDNYDIVHELLETLKFMDRLHSQSKLALEKKEISGTGIVDPISPEMASKYLEYNSKDAEPVINYDSRAFRSWLFQYMGRLFKPLEFNIKIVFKDDLHIANFDGMNRIYFINMLQGFFTVDGFVVLSPTQAEDIGAKVLDDLKNKKRIKGWKTKG